MKDNMMIISLGVFNPLWPTMPSLLENIFTLLHAAVSFIAFNSWFTEIQHLYPKL